MNGRVRVSIEGYASGGEGVARSGGLVVFVRGGVRGDELEAEIVSKEKNFARAEIREIVSPSPHRIEPDCPHFPACGGCDFRHISYEEELFLKQTRLKDALFRIGGQNIEPEPIAPATEENRARNKAVFHVGAVEGRRRIGFYGAGSHDIVPVSSCAQLLPAANAAVAALSRLLLKRSELFAGLTSAQTRTSREGGLQLSLFMSGQASAAELEAVRDVIAEIPRLQGCYLFEGGHPRLLYGARHLPDTLCGLSFELGPEAFYQVNTAQAERLYELVALYAGELEGKSVLDLFSGVGTITLHLAQKARDAAGIEISKRAVLDARRNARKNGATGALFFHADASAAPNICAGMAMRPDIVVADPPRTGLGRTALSALAELGAPRVVYVSCDPATLSRDVRELCAKGYSLTRCAPVDMFPRTANVETVVLLSHKDPVSHIEKSYRGESVVR